MAQPAERHDHPQADPVPVRAPATGWSGDVHGPVAELHRAIEDRFLAQPDPSMPAFAERPVEGIVRNASRAIGWLVLAAAFFATFQLIA